MDSNSVSPGICQRLISFIRRTVKRPSALPVSTQVPVEEGSSRNPIKRPKGSMDSEILIDFRHADGSERQGDSILDPKKYDLIVSAIDQTKLPNGLDRKENGVKKGVTIMESEKKKREDNESGGDHDETKARHPKQHWPLQKVVSNINEKTEAYISRRKKAMRRNYSLDSNQNSKMDEETDAYIKTTKKAMGIDPDKRS